MTAMINGNEVMNFTSLLVPEKQKATIEFDHDGDLQKFSLDFKTDESLKSEDKNSRRLEFSGKENFLSITFINWDSPLGISTAKPIEVGTTDKGYPIFILANVAKFGTLYRVDIQTMLGEKNESE